jgi:hypothetical protein
MAAVVGGQRVRRASTRLRTGVEAEEISRQAAGARAARCDKRNCDSIFQRARPCFCIGLPDDRARTKELKRRLCESVARAAIVDSRNSEWEEANALH